MLSPPLRARRRSSETGRERSRGISGNDHPRPASALYGRDFASIYDAVMADAAMPAILDGIKRVMTRFSMDPRTIIDAGCGTGRVLAALAAPGRRLIGVDRAPAMLAIARRRLGAGRALLFRQDLRALALPRRADLILCTFATINYILQDEDLDATFAGFARHLKPGGHVILDFIPMADDVGPAVRVRQDVSSGATRSIWDVHVDPGRGLTRTRIAFRSARGRTGPAEDHIQRWHHPARVRALLRRNGLVPRSCQPLGSGGPSPWQQIVARRVKRARQPFLAPDESASGLPAQGAHERGSGRTARTAAQGPSGASSGRRRRTAERRRSRPSNFAANYACDRAPSDRSQAA
jgi:SAM-dependent methyltransferase